MALRCTRRLLGQLRAPPAPVVLPATTVLGDWYANVYDARPQSIVLFLSERSLLAVLAPFGQIDVLTGKFRKAVLDLLTELKIPPDAVSAELVAMSEISIAPATNRRVLGCLSEAAFGVSTQFDCMHERWLGDHAMHMSRFTYSTTQYRPPHELAHELFRAALPGSRAGPVRIH